MGVELWAIANDDQDKLAAYAGSEGFDFPLLLDADGATIESWGLTNATDARGRKIPHPALVTLDSDGVVRDVYVETNYRLRPSVAEVLERLAAALGGTGVEAEADD